MKEKPVAADNLVDLSGRIVAVDRGAPGMMRDRGGTEPRFVPSFRARQPHRWPDATIPFVLDANLPRPERVTDAMRHSHDKTFVLFVERAGQANYVHIRRAASGCSSAVGMRGGEQFVNLGDECSMGATIHELGHSVGLWHEQSRIDRDRYVRVEFQNIDKRYWFDYDQSIANGEDLGPYDYGSVMRYSILGFPRNNLPSLTTVPRGIPIAQRTGPALVFDENGVQLPAEAAMGPGAFIRPRATGVGALPVTVSVGGVEADGVELKELSDFPGVVEIAARVPRGVPAGREPLMLTAGGTSAPYGVTLAVAP